MDKNRGQGVYKTKPAVKGQFDQFRVEGLSLGKVLYLQRLVESDPSHPFYDEMKHMFSRINIDGGVIATETAVQTTS